MLTYSRLGEERVTGTVVSGRRGCCRQKELVSNSPFLATFNAIQGVVVFLREQARPRLTWCGRITYSALGAGVLEAKPNLAESLVVPGAGVVPTESLRGSIFVTGTAIGVAFAFLKNPVIDGCPVPAAAIVPQQRA